VGTISPFAWLQVVSYRNYKSLQEIYGVWRCTYTVRAAGVAGGGAAQSEAGTRAGTSRAGSAGKQKAMEAVQETNLEQGK
jgi:hypothetical protein